MALKTANVLVFTGALIAVLTILVRYLIPIYPAEGINSLRLVYRLAIGQYGGVILALWGASITWRKETSKARKIRILILALAVGAFTAISGYRGNAETNPVVVVPHSKYRFTTDWVSSNEPNWRRILSEFKAKPGVHALEVGSFEGRSALWFLENILTHPMSTITCVDIWVGDYEKDFDENIRIYGYPQKVVKIKGSSDDVLRGLQAQRYDFVYIDGSHVAKDVLIDAVLAWNLLKPGGIIIFDDYNWTGIRSWLVPHFTPKIAINAFLNVFDPYVDVLHKEYQLVLRKKEHINLDSHGTVRRLLISIQNLLG